MNSKLKCIVNFLLILCLTLIISGCSTTNSTTDDTADPTTRTIDYSKESIDRSIESFQADFNQLRDKIANNTNEDAKDLKEDLSQLRTNVESFDRELTNAVTNGKLTNELKQSYDGFIETIKTDLNNLDKELDGK